MNGAVQGCLTSARKLWSERISCKGQLLLCVVVGSRRDKLSITPTDSKALALIWYRALTWYSLRLSPPRTHFEPWKAVGTRGRGSLTAR